MRYSAEYEPERESPYFQWNGGGGSHPDFYPDDRITISTEELLMSYFNAMPSNEIWIGNILENEIRTKTISGKNASTLVEFLSNDFIVASTLNVYNYNVIGLIDLKREFKGRWHAALVGDASYSATIYGSAQNGGASTFDPTLTNKFTTEVFVTPGVTTEGYTTRTTHKGRSSTELVLSATTGKIESVSTKTPLGNLSVGSDGSWTFGTNLSVGTDANGNLILDMSLPWFNGNSIGTTIKLSKEPWENIGNYLKSIEYHPAPVYPVPYYLIPAFAL